MNYLPMMNTLSIIPKLLVSLTRILIDLAYNVKSGLSPKLLHSGIIQEMTA
jgi:hypothetical protein